MVSVMFRLGIILGLNFGLVLLYLGLVLGVSARVREKIALGLR